MRPMHFLGLVWLLSLAACAPDITDTGFFQRHPDGNEPTNEVTLGTVSVAGQEVTLYAAEPLEEGWNTLRVEPGLAALNLRPVWRGAEHDVESPFPTPAPVETDAGQTFDVLFLTPPSISGTWELLLSTNGATAGNTSAMPVDVAPGWQVLRLSDPAYTLTWYAPRRPATGDDRLELVLHHFDGTRFTGVPGASLALDPYMDMGGGEGHSTPFTHPVDVGDGWYAGTINFIMSGGWDLTVDVHAPDGPSETVQFSDFNVQ